jgi:hypothetical protein
MEAALGQIRVDAGVEALDAVLLGALKETTTTGGDRSPASSWMWRTRMSPNSYALQSIFVKVGD